MTDDPRARLVERVTAPWDNSVDADVAAFGEDLATRYPGTAAVLFYGSCRRTGRIDGLMLDFYVLVDRMDEALGPGWQAAAGRLLPPNVYYAEYEEGGRRLRAKVAVMTLSAFSRRCAGRFWDTTLWARFSQPCQPVYLRDRAARDACARACCEAVCTMLRETVALAPSESADDVWTTAFSQTYRAEFRAEQRGWRGALYSQDQAFYDAVTPPALAAMGRRTPAGRARRRWSVRSVTGRLLTVARLMKAAGTFDGGLDYLAWKLGRHSGVKVEITDAMRRRPLLWGIRLFIRLRLRGAFR